MLSVEEKPPMYVTPKITQSRADLSNDKKKFKDFLLYPRPWASTSFEAQVFSNFYCSFSYSQTGEELYGNFQGLDN